MQIEVTEDAAQYLTPELIRSAFQISICDGLDYVAVHKVLVEEEYVIQKDKDGNDIEVLTAVPRVEPHPEWLKAYSESEMKDEVSSRNLPAALDRATPKAATKAREARKAAKQQNQATPSLRGGKPGWGRAREVGVVVEKAVVALEAWLVRVHRVGIGLGRCKLAELIVQ